MHLLFDIGGTNTRVALSDKNGVVGNPVMFETPPLFEDGIAMISKHARELASGQKIEAAAGGVKGPIRGNQCAVLNPPHLADWQGKPFCDALGSALETPVYIENDTALVGLGEAVAGAGKGQGIVAYLTVSTGVGGVKIINKTIDATALGFEPGHHIINFTERYAHLEHRSESGAAPGTAESYISGMAFERLYQKKPFEITDTDVWNDAAEILAVVLHNVAVMWSPETIVVGGSMITGKKGPCIPLAKAQELFEKMLVIFPTAPLVVPASLGDFGGIHGAQAFLEYTHKTKE